MSEDLISRQAAIDEVHRVIYEFFDICDDDEESPMTYKNEKLLEINKAISIRIRQLPSAERHGRWINGKCSVCGKHALYWLMSSGYYSSSYCPYCGASMTNEVQE